MRPSRLRMPEQIERASSIAAVSMGIALGVMPKANLSALAIFAWLTLANQLVRRVVIAMSISFLLSSFTYPYLQQIGLVALRFSPTQYLLGLLESIPFLPWFRLNNPAVLGGLVIGETIFGTLLLGNILFSRRGLVGSSMQANSVAFDSNLEVVDTAELIGPPRETAGVALNTTSSDAAGKQISPHLATAAKGFADEESVGLFADEPNLADQEKLGLALNSVKSPYPASEKHFAIHVPAIDEIELHQNAIASALVEDYSNMEIHESTIEIIRFRSREEILQPNTAVTRKPNNMTNTQSSSLLFANSNMPSDNTSTLSPLENIVSLPDASLASISVDLKGGEDRQIDFQKPIVSVVSTNTKSTSVSLSDPSGEGATSGNATLQPRDEALRYLLWHLSGDKTGSKLRERAS